jgi:hypothetical protein
VRVDRFSPFNTNTPYNYNGIGSSVQFDGTGDYLTVDGTSSATLSGDFTVELWAYPLDTGSYQEWLSKEYGFQIYTNSSGYWYVALSASNSSSYFWNATPASNPPAFGAWHHVAVTRSGSTYYFFVNGVLQATTSTTATPSLGTTNPWTVGAFSAGPANYPAKGYATDVRIINGTALYTSAFTPPTTPLTAVSNTQIILNMRNGAIFDGAMMSNLETTGTAGISTSVKKYGTGSISIGSNQSNTDYLTILSNGGLFALTGDFTVEFWLYKNSASQYGPIIETRTSDDMVSGIYLMDYNSTLVLYPFYGVAPAIETGVWIHFAVTRSGSTLTIYKNGVLAGTAACDPSTYKYDSGSRLSIGAVVGFGSRYFNGYIDDLRITKGYARYSPITPTASASNTTSTPLRGDGSPVSKFFLTSGSYGIFNTADAGNYLVVDFGQTASNVTTTYKNAAGSSWAPTSVLIQSSNDNSTWTTRATYSDNSSTSLQTISSTGTGRYWRMYQNSATRTGSGGYEWHINNFSMIGDALNGSFTPPAAALPVNG